MAAPNEPDRPVTAPEPRDRLYGTPGAEDLHFDPESVLEQVIDQEVDVEEWTTKPPRTHLPTVDDLLEWLADSDYDVTEGWWESATDATADPDVRAAADALLDTMASKVTFRMADRHVATHHYRWEGDDVDGEYVLDATRYPDTPARGADRDAEDVDRA